MMNWSIDIEAKRSRRFRRLRGLDSFAALVFLLGLSVSAPAADRAVVPLKAAPRAISHTGCHIGAVAGLAVGSAQYTGTQRFVDWRGRPTDGKNVGIAEHTLGGGLAGGVLGCDLQVDRLVLGVEADGVWTNKSGNGTATVREILSNHDHPWDVSFKTRENWIATLRGRLGYAFADRWMAYGTAGLARTGITTSFATSALPASAKEISSTRTGWVVGGGLDYRFDRNWSLQLEYLHADFGLEDNGLGNFNGPSFYCGALSLVNNRSRLTNDILRAGLIYNFDLGSAR